MHNLNKVFIQDANFCFCQKEQVFYAVDIKIKYNSIRYLRYLWNKKNRIILLEGIGGSVLLCQTQTSTKPDPNNKILL